MTDATHKRGCKREHVRPSTLLAGYVLCQSCRRMVRIADDPRADTDDKEPAVDAPTLPV